MSPVEFVTAMERARRLIAAVPGYEKCAAELSRRRIRYAAGLPDRGQAGLRGGITLGPEPFEGAPEQALVAAASTLVHELYHCRQNPFLKTRSFWLGVLTRTPLMRRYEQPAYQAQAAFLAALARSHPALAEAALQERQAALASFRAIYGGEL